MARADVLQKEQMMNAIWRQKFKKCRRNEARRRMWPALLIAVWLPVPAAVYAQQKELTIEESFLQEPIEVQIIRDQSASSDREGKMLALDFIRDYMDSGHKSPAVREILRDLALQGTLHQERVEGRLSNNYIDVRWRAAEYLGDFPQDEAAPVLRSIVLNDEEPSVAVAAIRALEKAGAYDTDTTEAIETRFRRFDAVRPDDRLALTVLNYYAAAPDPKPRFMTETVNHIRLNPFYQRSVRLTAEQLLKSLMGFTPK